MPTRSPTGREVRTLLTGSSFVGAGVVRRAAGGLGQGAGARRAVGERQEALGEGGAAVGSSADHQHGVVAGDGAEDVGELGPVERRGEELRGARRRAQQRQVGRRRRPRRAARRSSRASRLSEAADSPRRRGRAVAALGRARRRRARRTAARTLTASSSTRSRDSVAWVTRDAGVGEQLGELGLRAHLVVGQQVDDPLLPGALGRRDARRVIVWCSTAR